METKKWCCFLCFIFLSYFLHAESIDERPCSQSDRFALQSFSKGLDSGVDGWKNATTDCCAWAGVTCENSSSAVSGRRVIGLDLHGMKLRGSLSASLAELEQLQWLNLSVNSLRGAVPEPLLKLRQLERLDLSSNELSGAIPASTSIPAIQSFNISLNEFNGTHPVLRGSPDLEVFDVGYNMFAGRIDPGICGSSAKLRVLRFTMNLFAGDFPVGFGNCTSLQELAMELNAVSGSLPDDLFTLPSLRVLSLQENQLSGRMSIKFSNLSNLVRLDISFNSFWGNIPNVFGNLGKLEYFSAQSNRFRGSLPPSLANLPSLRMLCLRNNSLSGQINLNCSAMSQLCSLDLGANSFTGGIDELSRCHRMKSVNLAQNSLSGEISASFRNLRELSYISLSNNSFSNLSTALDVLQDCPSLTSLVLTKNFHDDESLPMTGIHGFRSIEVFVIASCHLSGSVPPWLADFAQLKVLDLSWNQLAGTVPPWLGELEHLFYVDLSNNSLVGEIPSALSGMKGLVNCSRWQQQAQTDDFPFFIKQKTSGRGLQYNQVSSFPPSLILNHNMLTGSILPGFGNLKNLHALDLSNNRLSGGIPEELSGMSSLESLDLSHNNLTGRIPFSLMDLNFLSSFSVAYNNLAGPIPSGGQFSTFTSSDYEGNPELCGFHLPPCNSHVAKQHATGGRRDKGDMLGKAIGIGLGVAFILVISSVLALRTHSSAQDHAAKAVADTDRSLELAPPSVVLLFQNNGDKAPTINDILKSTNNFDQANIVGCGGFGLVYKATLSDGAKVAIKRLSGDFGQMEREFKAEVETLSKAQHPNLVLLQGYCRTGSDRLLIYSYMENGSLDYWLHEKSDGGSTLCWARRLKIAQGAARGLAYLHLSCQPHILHRDIKSSNILLDENFEAHLADFGLARLICPYDTHVTTDLVGTLGYIPPEYGQSSVATFKGDVYSFGIVLLELLTGNRPVDMCNPKGGRELVSWVLQMKTENRQVHVLDQTIYEEKHARQMMQMLEIACLCISDSPKLRPLTHQLVQWLDNVGARSEAAK